MSLASTLLAGVLLCAGCSPSTPKGPLNLVLILVDTLRADHVGCYGAKRDTTPALDRLAAGGVRFERAYAAAPWTKPSAASILTGLYPSTHGAYSVRARLAGEVVTLAEMLKAKGYRTAGVISGSFLSGGYGFKQGFDVYDQREVGGQNYISTEGVTNRALDLLRPAAARRDIPFFLFVHYFDPHYTYKRHPEIGFAPESAGRLKGRLHIVQLRRLMKTMTAGEVHFLEALYDEEIRFTDNGIGRLLAGLRAAKVEGNTVVVVTGDHGEDFLSHGWLGHTRALYEELLRVPLIIRVPGRAYRHGYLVRQPVSLVSVTPTVLDLLGVEHAGVAFQGSSLVPLLAGGREDGNALVFGEVDFVPGLAHNKAKRAFKKAVIGRRFKLIRDDPTGHLELYDLRDDPGERHNLAKREAAIASKFLRVLEHHLAAARRAPKRRPRINLSPAELERLRDLGYASD